jgi:branched-chain amino acid transport system permease protein
MLGLASAPLLQAAFDPESQVAAPVITGIVQGSVYGLIALGLVLVYKSNRFFNFAQAEIGTVAAFIGSIVRTQNGSVANFLMACVAGIGAAVILGLLIQVAVIRPLFRASRVTLTVATVGVALLLIQAELLFSGANARKFAPVRNDPEGIPFLATSVTRTSWSELLIVIVFVAAGLGAAAFFKTRYGVGILAVSQEPTAASTVGISVMRISLLTWGLVGLLGGIAGVVYAPTQFGITPGFMTFGTGSGGPLIPAFVAAVLGGMTSLPGAFVGGLSIGLIEQFANRFAPDGVPGFKDLVVFGVLLLVLLVRPGGILGKEA